MMNCSCRYKTPMLRGDMDPGIDNFQTIEKLMATDLEHWLCNFYFEIIKLPRYLLHTFFFYFVDIWVANTL